MHGDVCCSPQGNAAVPQCPNSMSEFATENVQKGGFRYRITGKQSIERLDPIVASLIPNAVDVGKLEQNNNRKLDFVWETTCEKHLREQHQSALVLNKLHNSQIIESKSMLAYLQLLVDFPMLQTFVADNATAVEAWAKRRWENESSTEQTQARDWWVVKASKGNGGRDIWVMYKDNYAKVVSELSSSDEYVIQRYVDSPLLFRGKKFHFRCYSVMMADGAALVYRKAFILSAGLDFDYKDDDVRKHVTNLSVNKKFAGHPGQVPCNLLEEYPQLYDSIKGMWCAVTKAAYPYMQQQVSPLHFEFFGVDVIADTAGQCWLVEANRLPGLESSNNNKAQEDEMYNEMMEALLRIVLLPLCPALDTRDHTGDGARQHSLWDRVSDISASADGAVLSPSSEQVEPTCWSNLLKWKAFTRKNRQTILAEFV